MKRFLLAIGASCAALGAALSAQGAVVGINFVGTRTETSVTDDAFGVPAGNWVNLQAVNAPTDYGLVSVPGGKQITVQSITSGHYFYLSSSATPANGDQQVAWNYVDDGANNTGVTIVLGGLSALLSAGETYSVQVVVGSDNSDGLSNATVFDGSTELGTLTLGAVQNPFGRARYALSDELTGLSLDSITLSTTRSGTQGTNDFIRGGVAAVIIQTVPEPTSLGVLAIGALGLLVRRRK